MTIESISFLGNVAKVSLSDETELKIKNSEIAELGLIKGLELTEDKYHELKYRSALFEAKTTALKILNRRSHSEFELYVKLSRKGFDKKIISTVIDDFRDLGFLDDRKFAEQFVQSKSKNFKQGQNKIAAQLKKKGVSYQIIDKIIKKEINEDEELVNAKKLAEKKLEYYERKNTSKDKIKAKLSYFLNQRGFKTNIIFRVINDLNQEE